MDIDSMWQFHWLPTLWRTNRSNICFRFYFELSFISNLRIIFHFLEYSLVKRTIKPPYSVLKVVFETRSQRPLLLSHRLRPHLQLFKLHQLRQHHSSPFTSHSRFLPTAHLASYELLIKINRLYLTINFMKHQFRLHTLALRDVIILFRIEFNFCFLYCNWNGNHSEMAF